MDCAQELATLLSKAESQRTRDAEDEVFEKVRRCLLASRSDPTALGVLPSEALRQMLGFTTAWGAKRRIARARAAECLRLLLCEPVCCELARSDPELKSAMANVLLDDPETEVAERPSQSLLVAPKAYKDLGSSITSRDAGWTRQSQLQRIAEGLQLMCLSTSRTWSFPTRPLSTEFDTATDGFTRLFGALQRLGMRPARNEDEQLDILSMLESLGAGWLDLLRFLASMHRLEERRSLRTRVVEATHLLWRLQPGFRGALEGVFEQSGAEGLPWLEAGDWMGVAGAEVAQAEEANRASQDLVWALAPRMFVRPSFCVAEKCFRCGCRMGYILALRGAGWRQSTHDRRCLRRMLLRRQAR